MYTFFTYFKKIFHNHRKSLGKYFTSPFRYIYSIYIHSWAHLWHPFRKVFSSDCMEGMPTYKTHFLHTGAAHRTLKGFVNHCTFQQIKYLEKKKKKKQINSNSNFNIPQTFFEPFQNWMSSTDRRLNGTGNRLWTLCSWLFVSLLWLIWFNSTEMQNGTPKSDLYT